MLNMFTTFFTKAFPISTLIIFLSIPSSNAGNAYYTLCSSHHTCGKIQNIGYPFWSIGSPSSCGESRYFSLKCENGKDYPCLYVGDDHNFAKVLSINTSTHKMVIVSDQFFDKNISCLSPDMSMSLNYLSGAAKLTPNVQNISLFYGCRSSVSQYHPMSFTCSYLNGTKGTAFYFVETSEILGKESELCHDSYTVPVLKRELNELNKGKGTLLSVLKKGFEMEYMANFTACMMCENSGGKCGSDGQSPKFVCYCSAGPRPLECPKSGTIKHFVELSAALIVGIGMLICILLFFKKRKSSTHPICFSIGDSRKNENVETFLKTCGSVAPKRYTYADIRKITSNFKDKLGEGGFGCVYKGELSDGHVVAVKLLTKSKGDGEEFMNEVASIGRTNHVNVVTLLGFCFQVKKRALVYEFMPNGSLEKFIYGGSDDRLLPWKTLFNICVGIARGLDYLHRGCTTRILHFDIKPHNILLDEEFHPKISDFGLARLCPQKVSIISNFEARGTIGYIAPEICCRSLGSASHKSDVYSYGMMVLEIVGARKNIHTEVQNSSDSYFPKWINDALELATDDSLHHEIGNNEEIELKRKMVTVSLWCIQTNPSSRPPINRVVEMLEGNINTMQMPPMPSFSSPPRSLLSLEMPFNSNVRADSTEINFSYSRSD